MSAEPFWQAPRRLARLLEDGELTPSAFALLVYLGTAGGDRDGVSTTVPALASLLGVDVRTIRRALRTLEKLDLVDHDLRQGQRTPFRIRVGTAAVIDASLRTSLRTSAGPSVSEVVSEVTSDTRALHDEDRQANLSFPQPSTSDTRARAPETETEKETSSPTAVVEYAAAGLSIENDEEPNPVDAIAVLVAELRSGKDANTERTLRTFTARLPEAAFRAALEQLRERRRSRRRPLESEAKYVCSTLKAMVEQGTYAR